MIWCQKNRMLSHHLEKMEKKKLKLVCQLAICLTGPQASQADEELGEGLAHPPGLHHAPRLPPAEPERGAAAAGLQSPVQFLPEEHSVPGAHAGDKHACMAKSAKLAPSFRRNCKFRASESTSTFTLWVGDQLDSFHIRNWERVLMQI